MVQAEVRFFGREQNFINQRNITIMNKTLAPMVEMAHKHRVKFFADIVHENGHEIVKYDNVPMNAKHVMSAFCYSEMYGGAPDSFKYYNDYSVVVENV